MAQWVTGALLSKPDVLSLNSGTQVKLEGENPIPQSCPDLHISPSQQ